jgi:choline dehydrogenase
METSIENQVVDYIIVGAGSAGCVVAYRLVNAGKKVLLIEAGKTDEAQVFRNTDIGSMVSTWGSEYDWKYQTAAGEGVKGRRIDIAQGKVSGGSSSINAMMYIRGSKKDFDHWAHLGNEGWSFEEVLPFFKKSENFEKGETHYHGAGGPLSVIDYKSPSAISVAFIEAAKELNFRGDGFDCNGEVHENGAFFYQSTRTADNVRCSTSFSFIEPILSNPNFTLISSATVSKVIIDNKKAVGVIYIENGIQKTAYVTKEIILSAGAFASPKLLMLSGVGPSEELAKHAIDLVQDLPGVGQNLQDHLLLGVGFKSKVDLGFPSLLSEAGLFTYTKELPESESPNLQFFFGPVQFIESQYKVDGPGFTFAPILARPISRGSVSLRSSNALENSEVQPNYLTAQEDVDVLVAGIELARKFAGTAAMAQFNGGELAPGEEVKSKEALEDYVRSVSSTVWHPVGTCKMGMDKMAVVNAELKVHGIEGLRVADASVMPTITSGNTNAATIMIGEKMADIILKINN